MKKICIKTAKQLSVDRLTGGSWWQATAQNDIIGLPNHTGGQNYDFCR